VFPSSAAWDGIRKGNVSFAALHDGLSDEIVYAGAKLYKLNPRPARIAPQRLLIGRHENAVDGSLERCIESGLQSPWKSRA
jgi:hypothetical protein